MMGPDETCSGSLGESDHPTNVRAAAAEPQLPPFPRTGTDLYAAFCRHMVEQANTSEPSWDQLGPDEASVWARLAAELVEQAGL